MFTNKVEENIISGNLISDVSDHFVQFCISQSPISKEKPPRLLSRDFSNFTERNFINDLLLTNWDYSVPDNETNVNKLFLSFYNKLNKIVNKRAPIKFISRRKGKCFSKPWITTGIRKSIHPYQKHLNYDVNIKILDNRGNKYFNLECKEYVKYLGVMIDNHLSWKHHINYVALKISRNIGILLKFRHFVPPKTLFGISNSLILPYLSYGLVAWGQAAKTHLEKLLRLQKRAVRLINFAPFCSHAVPYFLRSNNMPITMRT